MRKKMFLFGAMVLLVGTLTACDPNGGSGYEKPTSTISAGASTSSSSKETTNRCQFIENGQRNCKNKATHGQLCEKHFNYLNGIYNDMVGFIS
ncbi:MAG: hypothetical protein NC299_06080 [Lachnospiraceae bacterium]|nr:hypothetical protein [Ruminococcus sp.]MCM1274921.1 hypothetical protein [Lachnospiraceae bacterium]